MTSPDSTMRPRSAGFARVAVIFNPTAGWRSRRRLRRVVHGLIRRGCQVTLYETTGSGDATELAREASAADHDIIAAAGGDGTVNEVVNGMIGSRAALALIPLGTANILACEIGMPLQPARIADIIARGAVRTIHVGRADGRYFVAMAGAGFDARVVAMVRPGLKRWLGKLAYVIAAVQQLLHHRDCSVTVTIDGMQYRAGQVIVANLRFYGGRFLLAPGADLAAASFQVFLFNGHRRRDFLRYAAALILGRVGRLRDLRTFTACGLGLVGGEDMPVQIDGDVRVRLPLGIAVADVQLPLIVPGSPAGNPG